MEMIMKRVVNSHCFNWAVLYREARPGCTGATLVLLFLSLIVSGCTTLADSVSPSDVYSESYAIFELRQEAGRAYQQSRWIEAVRLYQRVVEQVPGDTDAWFRLGNTYAQQGAFQRAIHAYEKSLAQDAEQPKAWFNLSTAYLLNAQSAMRGAHSRLRDGDPAKRLIAQRLTSLGELVHGRFEEGVAPAVYTH